MRFTPRCTAVAIVIGMASALVGGCAMQSQNSALARADTEDASHPSTDTTLTAQGDPVPDVVTQVAVVEPVVPAVQVAQVEPTPAATQRDDSSVTQVASTAESTSAQPMTYSSTPAPSTASTSANPAYGTDEPAALPPRADRN